MKTKKNKHKHTWTPYAKGTPKESRMCKKCLVVKKPTSKPKKIVMYGLVMKPNYLYAAFRAMGEAKAYRDREPMPSITKIVRVEIHS